MWSTRTCQKNSEPGRSKGLGRGLVHASSTPTARAASSQVLTRTGTAMLAFLASASGYSPIVRARPLMLPEAAAFYTSVVHGEELTPAQRLLLERRSLNEMKERFRVAGRYPPPVFDRRLPSCLLLARESEEGPILGCAGLELALVDDEKRIVLRRSRSEALLRERLDEGGAEAGAQAGGGASISPASGRRFHRPLLPDEMDEETAALRLQASWYLPWRCLLWLHLLWLCLLWPLRGSCRRALVTAWLVVGGGRRFGHGARGAGPGGRR